MKRITRAALSILLCLSTLFSLISCVLPVDFGGSSAGGISHSVTFVAGETEKTVSVVHGSVVSPPRIPQTENRLFAGWYEDEDFLQEYLFSDPVYEDITLYGRFVLDGAALTNAITQKIMPALVTVQNVYPVTKTQQITSQGSGFIYKIEGGKAYALTNCHVAYTPVSTQSITVEDFRGETHEAQIYRKNPFAAPAIAAEYDLAILVFSYEGSELCTIPFAEEDIGNSEEVISLGSPENQSHAITFGEVLGYRKANLSDISPEESNVTFDIVYHTAAITNGSSGGPLLNGDLSLVGINYAGIPPEDGDGFGHGCAVPLAKVIEFLSLHE